MKATAAYIRVSTRQQDGKLQEKAIRDWAKAKGRSVRYYRDKLTGKTMDRPGWNRLEADMKAGKVRQLVVWKLDRLGRTTSGLTRLFDFLRERKIKLISLTEGFDLLTPMGRLVADIMASMAAYETELRGERVAAGQAIAREQGKRWGGSKKGWTTLKPDQISAIVALDRAGTPKAVIARSLGLSWPTVHKVIKQHGAAA